MILVPRLKNNLKTQKDTEQLSCINDGAYGTTLGRPQILGGRIQEKPHESGGGGGESAAAEKRFPRIDHRFPGNLSC